MAGPGVNNLNVRYWGDRPQPQPVDESPHIITRVVIGIFDKFVQALAWNNHTNAAAITSRFVSVASNVGKVFGILFSAITKGNSASETRTPGPLEQKISNIAGIGLTYIKIAFGMIILMSAFDILIQLRRLHIDPLDVALRIIKDVSDGGFGSTTFIAGLQQASLISSTALKFIPAINIVAAGLSSADFFINLKDAIIHKRNVDNLNACPNRVNDLKNKIIDVIELDDATLEKQYGVPAADLRRRLEKVLRRSVTRSTNDNPIDVRRAAKEEMRRTVANLRTRAKQNVNASQISMLAAVVSTVALVALALSPIGPLALVGFAMLALSAMLYTSSLIYERRSYYHFQTNMGIKEKPVEVEKG